MGIFGAKEDCYKKNNLKIFLVSFKVQLLYYKRQRKGDSIYEISKCI